MIYNFRSRYFAILLLITSTVWDAWTSWLTAGNKLYLDGNPIVRTMNWPQLLLLLVFLQAAFAVCFWFAWEKQEVLWPDQKMSFWQFLNYRLKKGFALNFTRDHLKRELVYTGMLLLWFPTFGHALAGLIMTSPLVGGPSFLDIFRRLGIHNPHTAQNFTVLINVAGGFILAHWPIYLCYQTSRGDGSKTLTRNASP